MHVNRRWCEVGVHVDRRWCEVGMHVNRRWCEVGVHVNRRWCEVGVHVDRRWCEVGVHVDTYVSYFFCSLVKNLKKQRLQLAFYWRKRRRQVLIRANRNPHLQLDWGHPPPPQGHSPPSLLQQS